MDRSGAMRAVIAGAIALLAMTGSVFAEDAQPQRPQLVTCRPTTARVAAASVENLRIGMESSYAWATATVHLVMQDRSVRDYRISGRADPIDKALSPNPASVGDAGFVYPEFACTVQYSAIKAVENCRRTGAQRMCEIGVEVFGMPMTYTVSMKAQRIRAAPVEASAIP